MSVVEDIQAIQAAYPSAHVNVSVYTNFVSVSVHPLPTEQFPERDDKKYPNVIYVKHGEPGAYLSSHRYEDKDVEAAVRAAAEAVLAVKR
ncbi:hypothetical protein JABBAWOKKIE_64 [Mycobacterium phage Jabbawokkie]|uniref:Uncharacterized protein n=1 Tax=Mycobacterium phage Zapner TaxID=1486474 RepID=A0A059VG41_9CAUD|nr:hypothetical protein N850_gp062 [Mycobacterium phage Jabbawokkie]YP_009963980.1 hypothetical protein I5I04_gp063 [Mycobacterium phage Zapner]AGT12163.1 hypothetical protein JABBAWOKKIE_64 [Mycobacterium phage Jabbawokkie]AHZ95517.1 hypothetical protein PBI_ZAPNER_63 [Mycobacterium phage Zapner]